MSLSWAEERMFATTVTRFLLGVGVQVEVVEVVDQVEEVEHLLASLLM